MGRGNNYGYEGKLKVAKLPTGFVSLLLEICRPIPTQLAERPVQGVLILSIGSQFFA